MDVCLAIMEVIIGLEIQYRPHPLLRKMVTWMEVEWKSEKDSTNINKRKGGIFYSPLFF